MPGLAVQMGLRISSEEGKTEAASRARTQAEADAARLREEHRTELEGQRVHYTGLLAKANSAQVHTLENPKYADLNLMNSLHLNMIASEIIPKLDTRVTLQVKPGLVHSSKIT